MTQKFLLPVVGVAITVALSSCVAPEPAPQPLRRGGYSLDQPASRNTSSRYQEEKVSERRSTSSATSSSSESRGIDYDAPAESGNALQDSTSSLGSSSTLDTRPSDPAPLSDSPKVETPVEVAPVTPPAPPVVKPKPQHAYATPVIGKRGFVYPPGVEQKADNIIDVREFSPGAKARDPKTGTVFLVP